MSFLWLLLQILPLLLIVAALFYWLGLRQPRADLADSLAGKQDLLEREQNKADSLSRQLNMAEEQINQLTSDYEKLQRGAIPRRLLSDAENEIIKLQRQLASFTSPSASRAEILHPPDPVSKPAEPAPPSQLADPKPISEPSGPEPQQEPPAELSLAEILASLPPSPKPTSAPAPEDAKPGEPAAAPPPAVDSPPLIDVPQPLFVESSGPPKRPPVQKRRGKSR